MAMPNCSAGSFSVALLGVEPALAASKPDTVTEFTRNSWPAGAAGMMMPRSTIGCTVFKTTYPDHGYDADEHGPAAARSASSARG